MTFCSQQIKEYLVKQLPKAIVLGPANCTIYKMNDIYRKILYLKCEEYGMLIKAKDRLEQYIEVNSGFDSLRVQFDFNPMNIF